MKKFILILSFMMSVTTALAGCSQSNGDISASIPETSASSQSSQIISSETQEHASEATTAAASDTAVTEPAAATSPETAAPVAATDTAVPGGDQNTSAEDNSLSGIDLNVQFGDGGSSFALHLYDNETASKIAEYVGTAEWRLPIYHYDDYENWEVMQYYDIPSRYEIPSSPVTVTSEKAGTVYYSEPNRMILFFGDAEVSSEYTPVGYIDYSEEFADAVENNPVLEGWGNKIVYISK